MAFTRSNMYTSGVAMIEAIRVRAWWRVVLGYGLAVAALYFASHSVGLGLSQLSREPLPVGATEMLVTTLFLVAHTLCNREAFVRLCRSLDSGVADTMVRRIWGRSLLAKYVPGGVWQLVGRGLQLRDGGARHRSALSSGLFETIVSLAICIAIAACAYLYLASHSLFAILLALLVVALLVLLCQVFPGVHHPMTALSACALYALAMPLYLAAYACIANAVPLVELTAHLFAGTSAGMLAFFVPGGVGVRESVVGMLGRAHGGSLLAAMVLVRLLIIGVEAVLSLISLRRTVR